MDFYHAAIIQGGKYARNSFAICKTQPAGGVLLKMIKYLEEEEEGVAVKWVGGGAGLVDSKLLQVNYSNNFTIFCCRDYKFHCNSYSAQKYIYQKVLLWFIIIDHNLVAEGG